MSDAIPLPSRPSLEQYKKLARELQRASAQSAKEHDVHAWAVHWLERCLRTTSQELTAKESAHITDTAEAINGRWIAFNKKRSAEGPSLTDAQFFLAREHGFPSWPTFAEHVRLLGSAHSPVANFEAAADAIVLGDEQTLSELLQRDPSLARTRSLREHRSTLLHYCSANGVEDYRQKTPRNAVAITRQLLDAGAEVNAESEAYGGRSTTLMLTATSVHPERAGVQIELLELLLESGATIDVPGGASTVNACLRNGRGEAAAFLAGQGGRLDLDGAAGVGLLDVVRSFFAKDGVLRSSATPQQLANGFGWACEFGRTNVVEFLLQQRIRADMPLDPVGTTALHFAALDGQVGVVRLLLAHGANVHAVENRFRATPLGWALHGWSHRMAEDEERHFCEVVNVLVRAGASTHALQNEVANSQMLAALRGEYRSISSTA